ncbi:MAG: hypothetical protein RPS47_10075 [Colwellia sp.]|jgi:hypothetical protein
MKKASDKSSKSIFEDTAKPNEKANPAVGGDSKLDFKLVRKGSAPKLRDETESIQYELGHVEGNLSLRIISNDKDGLFSGEAIPISNITTCLSKYAKGTSFTSSVFTEAFSKKSSNNAGFLAAILRAEKVLAPVKGKLFLHELTIDSKTLEKYLSK